MPRVCVTLSEEEHEWLHRHAYWQGSSMAGSLRRLLLRRIAEEGYLRPPDNEPQDFGYEKELLQHIVALQENLAE